mmetsp:Transcript_11234/g.31524  ORF Transcript_11234/g.31524 Transcript_11234/m.31524 type:complete len:202 (+) Transcript_11234:214-819(+)
MRMSRPPKSPGAPGPCRARSHEAMKGVTMRVMLSREAAVPKAWPTLVPARLVRMEDRLVNARADPREHGTMLRTVAASELACDHSSRPTVADASPASSSTSSLNLCSSGRIRQAWMNTWRRPRKDSTAPLVRALMPRCCTAQKENMDVSPLKPREKPSRTTYSGLSSSEVTTPASPRRAPPTAGGLAGRSAWDAGASCTKK